MTAAATAAAAAAPRAGPNGTGEYRGQHCAAQGARR